MISVHWIPFLSLHRDYFLEFSEDYLTIAFILSQGYCSCSLGVYIFHSICHCLIPLWFSFHCCLICLTTGIHFHIWKLVLRELKFWYFYQICELYFKSFTLCFCRPYSGPAAFCLCRSECLSVTVLAIHFLKRIFSFQEFQQFFGFLLRISFKKRSIICLDASL